LFGSWCVLVAVVGRRFVADGRVRPNPFHPLPWGFGTEGVEKVFQGEMSPKPLYGQDLT